MNVKSEALFLTNTIIGEKYYIHLKLLIQENKSQAINSNRH